ncbi:MAG TPA: ABC transporter permease [Vicinamibacterales bacterium]|nr:ABC transporter permease [Vicinamibacterales bacterium]
MNWLQRLRHRERLEHELDAEIDFHVDELVRDLMRDGLSERDALRQAAREFGYVPQIKDDCRRARGTEWLVDLIGDARLGLRMLKKERAFSIVAIGALSLGLGVSTVFFSLVYAFCLAALPFAGAGRLSDISLRDDSGRQPSLTLSQARAIADEAPLAGIGYFTRRVVPVRTRDSSARQITIAYVSDDALALIGEEPSLGREFQPQEYRQARGAPALVSARLATDLFGSPAAALGHELFVDTVSSVIVGVISSPRFPERSDAWQPIASFAAAPDQPGLSMFGALKPGGPDATDVSSLIESALRRRSLLASGRVHVTLVPLESRYHADIRQPGWIAFIMAGALVVLIASSNVGNLLLSRGVRRTNEVATRLSLGATRGRIFRQLIAETSVLCAAACGGGAFVAWIALLGLRAQIPASALADWTRIGLDWHIVAMLFAFGAATVLLCGIAPAVQLMKTPATPWHARTTTASRSVERWSATFLTVQLALSMLLLCEMGLTVQLYRAVSAPRAPAHLAEVLTAQISLSPRKYGTPQERSAFYADLRDRLRAAGLITNASFEGALPGTERVPRHVAAGSIHEPGTLVASVTVDAGFFDTVGVSLESGRTFEANSRDTDGAVVVNDRFASLFFGATAVVGRQIRVMPAGDSNSASAARTIIGVVPSFADQATLEPAPVIFLPRDLRHAMASTLIARGTAPPQQLASVLTNAIAKLDRDVAVSNVVPLTDATWQAQWIGRMSQTLITGIASIGFFLAMIGVAALTAHRVGSRARELSVRVALGATPTDVVRAVLRPLALQLAAGLLVGGLLTVLWQGGFGSPGATGSNLLLVAALVTAATAIFSAWPARRAAHADPVAALNSQT